MDKNSITYQDLKNKYSDPKHISYADLLKTVEWKEKRQTILKRDGFTCTKCKRRSTRELSPSAIQQLVRSPSKNKIQFSTVGSHLKSNEYLSNPGHYWFFSPYEHFYENRAAYWDEKFVRVNTSDKDCVFIKSNKRYHLDIHHKLYILNKLPWENMDKDLTTLCNWCHWDLHKNEKVKAYHLENGELVPVTMTPCHRCYGAGWKPEFAHVEAGICFHCLGKRFEELVTKTQYR